MKAQGDDDGSGLVSGAARSSGEAAWSARELARLEALLQRWDCDGARWPASQRGFLEAARRSTDPAVRRTLDEAAAFEALLEEARDTEVLPGQAGELRDAQGERVDEARVLQAVMARIASEEQRTGVAHVRQEADADAHAAGAAPLAAAQGSSGSRVTVMADARAYGRRRKAAMEGAFAPSTRARWSAGAMLAASLVLGIALGASPQAAPTMERVAEAAGLSSTQTARAEPVFDAFDETEDLL
ncbi:MAG: hypothetical protein AAFR04_05845 [Pseudomonadota bacterium]